MSRMIVGDLALIHVAAGVATPNFAIVMGQGVPDVFGYVHNTEIALGTGKKWETSRLFYAGKREDGYHFFGYKKDGGELFILAGCRTFRLNQARRHWQGHEQSLDFVDAIEAWAETDSAGKAPTTAVAVPTRGRTGNRVSTAYVEEFMGKQLYEMFDRWVYFQKNKIVQGGIFKGEEGRQPTA